MRTWAVVVSVLLSIFGCASWCQAPDGSSPVRVDLGWVALVQQSDGWLVTDAPPPPQIYLRKERTLRRGDLLTTIDGQETPKFGPLAIALMLGDVPFRAVPMTLRRNKQILQVDVFGEGVLTDGTTKAAPSYSSNRLQMRHQGAPQFSLPDLTGRVHTLDQYRGKWLLVNVWGTWCSGCLQELAPLKDLSSRYEKWVTVVSVAINDTPAKLTTFVKEHQISYPVLLGGTFDDAFSCTYNLHSAPTNLVISPDGQVRFVGGGPMSLKGAVETIATAVVVEPGTN